MLSEDQTHPLQAPDRPGLAERLAGPGAAQVFSPSVLPLVAAGVALGRIIGLNPDWTPRLAYRIDIPEAAPSAESFARRETVQQVSTLAEAHDWAEVSALIRNFESVAARDGGHGRHEVAAYAARMALAEATEAAQYCTMMTIADIPLEVLDALEVAAAQAPDDHILAALAARAHIDVGWYHRTGTVADEVNAEGWAAMRHHYRSAEMLLSRFEAEARLSPVFAEAAYFLCLAQDDEGLALRRAYEDWVSADPTSLTPHMTHAFHLLPRWFGTYHEVEAEARRAAKRTEPTFGATAYAAYYLSVLPRDDWAMEHVDPGHLLRGLDDFIAYRNGDQTTVNDILAFLWAVSAPLPSHRSATAAANRAMLRAAIGPMARRHLRAVNPASWPYGRDGALRTLAYAFRDDLAAGRHITFDTGGVRIS